MHLTPKEIDKLMLLSLGMVAERRMKKGLKLNYPEAVAYITSTALEGAREGKTVEEVMKGAASVLKKSDVMEGVADMIDLLQVEAVFTDGSRLVSIHHPIKYNRANELYTFHKRNVQKNFFSEHLKSV